MADNKVKFLRGTAAEYEASTKDNDVFYYTTDTKKLYLGTNEVTGVGKAGIGENAEIFNNYEQNTAKGRYSHAEGNMTATLEDYSHIEGYSSNVCPASITNTTPVNDVIALWNNTKFSLADGVGAHVEGRDCMAFGNYTHAEGLSNIALHGHAEGSETYADGVRAHTEGEKTTAFGEASHAEGYSNSKAITVVNNSTPIDDIVSSWQSTKFCLTKGQGSHVEGANSLALADHSHAEGSSTIAYGKYSHAEGLLTQAIGDSSHAGGTGSEASKIGSFVHGDSVKASNNKYEVAFGTFNKSNADTLFSIGNGASDTARKNAFEITKTTGKIFDKEIATKEELEAHAGNAEIHVTAAQKSVWDELSNPNLLINPDFRINQRGQSEYSSGYTVDSWYIGGNKCTVTPGSDGILITSAINPDANTHAFWQKFENPFAPGKYTLSLNVSEVSGAWSARIRTVNASGDYVDSYYTSFLHKGVNSVSVDLPEGEYISAVSAGINVGTEVGNSVKFAWVKLEVGDGATPFVSPDPAVELLKCQRYLYKLTQWGRVRLCEYTANFLRFAIATPVAMRAKPSLINADNLVVRSLNINEELPGFTYEVDSCPGNQILIKANKANHSVTDGTIVASGGDVLFSAEL